MCAKTIFERNDSHVSTRVHGLTESPLYKYEFSLITAAKKMALLNVRRIRWRSKKLLCKIFQSCTE